MEKNLQLEEFIILYVDILGYRDHIKLQGEQEFLEKIDYAFEHVKNQVSSAHEDFDDYLNGEMKCKIFSDNIVVCYKSKDRDYSELEAFLFFSLLLQRYLITEYDMFIRGGIITGDIYIDDEYIFGSGLIKAYDLESKMAVYPRIIIAHDYPLKISDMQVCRKDADGYMFLDYLQLWSKRPPFYQLDDIDFYINHKELIENGLKQYKSQDSILQKYMWCKEYHNKACGEYELFDLIIEDIDPQISIDSI